MNTDFDRHGLFSRAVAFAAFAHDGQLRKGGALTEEPAVAEAEIKRAAKAISKRYSEALCAATDGLPRDTAFLTVLAGVRDVSRHIGNIAERIPALG